MSSGVAFAPQRVQSELVDVWAVAVERGLEADGHLAMPKLEWSPCALDNLEVGDQKWWTAELEGANPLRLWIGVSSVSKGLDSLSSALEAAENRETLTRSDLASDGVIERIVKEFVEVSRREQGEVLSLRVLRQAPCPPPVASAFVARAEGGLPLLIVSFERETQGARSAGNSRLTDRASFGQLLGINLPLSVRLGKVRLPIEEVLRLKIGSVLELDRAHEDPVDLVVNGAVVARGDLLAVDGACGLRIREVLRPEGSIRIESA